MNSSQKIQTSQFGFFVSGFGLINKNQTENLSVNFILKLEYNKEIENRAAKNLYCFDLIISFANNPNFQSHADSRSFNLKTRTL